MLDNTFQTILIGFFILVAIFAVGLFATQPNLIGGDGGDQQIIANFSVWGVWSNADFNNYLDASGVAASERISVSYTAVPADELQTRLVNAIARGSGPDVVLFSNSQLLQLNDFLTPIPQSFFPVRQYRNSFLEGAEIFLTEEGMQALPVAVDPLVLYWNRDLFTAAGLTAPPATWGEVNEVTGSLTQTDNVGNITSAGIGLGSGQNITFFKPILTGLFMETGNDLVARSSDGRLRSTLSGSGGQEGLASAVELYTQYANPTSENYSWNNSFESDTRAFTAGNLAMYLAPASQIKTIRAQNPNLNFDVAPIPQLTGGQARTQGDMYGFGLLSGAANKGAIVQVLSMLTGSEANATLAETTAYTSVHRQVVSQSSGDPYQEVFNEAAIVARGWLDPDPQQTKQALRNLISRVVSGEADARGSLTQLSRTINNMLRSVTAP